MNCPPDILAILEVGKDRRKRLTLQEHLKDCRRLFVCGLALDFCVLDTCVNAAALGFSEVYLVLDACRAAHIETVGAYGTGFLSPPRDLLPQLQTAGAMHTFTVQVTGQAAIVTPASHIAFFP